MLLFSYTAAVFTMLFGGAAAFLLGQNLSLLGRIYTYFLLSAALWLGSNTIADLGSNHTTIWIASGLAMIGGAASVVSILYFAYVFVHEKLPTKQRALLYCGPAILFSALAFTHWSIEATIPIIGAPSQTVLGVLYIPYSLWLLASLVYTTYTIIRSLPQCSSQKRRQGIYVVIGFGSLLLGGALCNAILPLFGYLNYFNLGPQFALFFMVFTGYAIFQHNLFDVRVIIQRGFIYTVLFSLIVLIFLSVVHIISMALSYQYGDVYSDTRHVISGIFASIISVIVVPKFNTWLKRTTDPVFFKDTYNYSDGLKQLSESINQNIRLENITKTSSVALQEILRAKEVRIFEISHCGKTALPTNTVPAHTLNIPIQHKNTWIGCIEIDEKRSGDNYTARDLSLIETFANQIAAAFEKARLYKEVEDYSHTLEERVAERTSEVEALQENRNQIMLDISHQLQTPLTVVKNGIHEMKHAQPANPHITAFEKSIDDVSQFIYQMLHLANLEHGRTQKARLDLSKLLTELAEYYLVICLDKKITLKSNITHGLVVHGDKKQLEEAITSIVSNAVKYMHPIDSGRDRRISITLLQQESSAEIIINDTGIGINADALPQVFNRFYRAKNSAVRIDGNGLGLAIAGKIISLHHGTISATSTEGSGSTFVITLPLYTV